MKKLLASALLIICASCIPAAVHAEGCCVTQDANGVKQCVPDAGLTRNPGETYSDACFRTYPITSYSTTHNDYACSQTCDTVPTGQVTGTPQYCCVYSEGNCKSSFTMQCEDLQTTGGPLAGQLQTTSCAAIDTCGGHQLHTGVTSNPPASNVRLKLQVTLPGSKFIAGQEISITGTTLGEYIAALYAFSVGAIALLAAIMIFYAGIRWLTAGGNRANVQSAKEHIMSALIGLLIAVGAYLLLLTISPKLVKFSSLSLTQVARQNQEFAEMAFGFKGVPPTTVTLTQDAFNAARARAYEGKTVAEMVQQAAIDYGVSANLIYAIMMVESGGNATVVSPAGACGIMQLLPGTASGLLPDKPTLTCDDLLKPAYGIRAGAAYLARIKSSTCPTSATRKNGSTATCTPSLTQCRDNASGGENVYVYAAYNGGQGANCSSVDCPGQTWWECSANAGYAETRSYVQKVQAALEKIKGY
jgi:soluble lytic murein transglycosylase-like protein